MTDDGRYVRDARYLNDRITADGRDGWPVSAGRYRLAVARACPWANRAIIVRRLLGLEPVLSMAVAGPTHDQRSWTFDLDPGGRDPVLGIERLAEAYDRAEPGYDRGVTVPAIIDIPTGAASPATSPRSPSTWRPSGRPCIVGVLPTSTPRTDATRSTRWRRRCTPTSTTGSTGPGSPPPRPATRRPTTGSSIAWTG